VYPEIGDRAEYITLVIRGEEERFLRTLDQGVDLFERLAGEVVSAGGRVIGGEDAFRLYDTYGFPVDLTRIMAEEKGLAVDMAGFEKAMETQRARAREASVFFSETDEGGPWNETGVPGEGVGFVGYTEDSVDARLIRYRESGSPTCSKHTLGCNDEDGRVELVFDRTPFYAISGGQVSDTGKIVPADGAFVLRVIDVHDYPGTGRVHLAEVAEGHWSADSLRAAPACLSIDIERRGSIRRNHSATHLLHAGLRSVLGAHVRQSGSSVDPERLRFDFNHFSGLTTAEIEAVEEYVTRAIMEDHPVHCIETTLEEARAMGAMSLFEEKYGAVVRMVRMGDVSMELCGGTHVSRTGEIGLFRILYESSVAAGMRRIEAITGMRAYEAIRSEHEVVQDLSRRLNTAPGEMADRVEALSAKVRDLEKQVRRLKTEGPSAGGGPDILDGAVQVNGVRVAFGRRNAADVDELKSYADAVRERIGSGVGIIGAEIDGKISIVVVVTDDLIAKHALKAGDIVKRIALIAGGSGGGRPHIAMAGGKDPAKLDDALAAAPGIVGELIKG
jgi:alanyl-tRNA synthetase